MKEEGGEEGGEIERARESARYCGRKIQRSVVLFFFVVFFSSPFSPPVALHQGMKGVETPGGQKATERTMKLSKEINWIQNLQL